jgi:hypothetical protein
MPGKLQIDPDHKARRVGLTGSPVTHSRGTPRQQRAMTLLENIPTWPQRQILRRVGCLAAAGFTLLGLPGAPHVQAQTSKPVDVAQHAEAGEVRYFFVTRDDDRLAAIIEPGALPHSTPEAVGPPESLEIDLAITEVDSSYCFGETATNVSVSCSGTLLDSIKPRIDLACEMAPGGSDGVLQYRLGCEFGTGRLTASAGLTGIEPLPGARSQQRSQASQLGLDWRVSPDLVVTADVQFPLGATGLSAPIFAVQAMHLF